MEKGYILSILSVIATSCALLIGTKLLAKLGVGVAISDTSWEFEYPASATLITHSTGSSKIILTSTDEDNVKIIGGQIKEKSWS